MTTTRRLAITIATALAAATAAATITACASDATRGYVWGAGFPDNIETVAVPIFRNDTLSRGIGARVTEALQKEIARVTPYAIAERSAADSELNGTVTNVRLAQLATDPDSGLGEQMALDITVTFSWTNRRTGDVLLTRRNFRSSGFFVPARGANEPIETGQNDAVAALARNIVAEMRGGW